MEEPKGHSLASVSAVPPGHYLLLAFVLMVFCAVFALVEPWGVDEGQITVFLAHFISTGKFNYGYMAHDDAATFGRAYFETLLFFQHHPLDPAGYIFSRMVPGALLFASLLAVTFYLCRATNNILVAAIGTLLLVLNFTEASAFSIRFDAPYVLAICSLIFILAMTKRDDALNRPASVTLALLVSFLLCCFAVLSHPNGVACVVCWGLVAFHYRNKTGAYRWAGIAAAVFLLTSTYFILLAGRSVAQFYRDLATQIDSNHNLNISASFIDEFRNILGMTSRHEILGFELVAALLVTALLTYRVICPSFRQNSEEHGHLLEVMVAVCFLFISIQSAKWLPYNLLLLPPLICLICERSYKFAEQADIGRGWNPKLDSCIPLLIVLSVSAVLGVKAYKFSRNQSLFQYTFHQKDFDYAKFAQLKTELAGKRLSLFSETRVIPLFYFMDLGNFFRDSQGLQPAMNATGKDLNAPWATEDGAFAICSVGFSWATCDQMKKFNYYPDYDVKPFDKIRLFGDNFIVYTIKHRSR